MEFNLNVSVLSVTSDPLETEDVFTLGKTNFQLLTTIQQNCHSNIHSRSLIIMLHDIWMSAWISRIWVSVFPLSLLSLCLLEAHCLHMPCYVFSCVSLSCNRSSPAVGKPQNGERRIVTYFFSGVPLTFTSLEKKKKIPALIFTVFDLGKFS